MFEHVLGGNVSYITTAAKRVDDVALWWEIFLWIFSLDSREQQHQTFSTFILTRRTSVSSSRELNLSCKLNQTLTRPDHTWPDLSLRGRLMSPLNTPLETLYKSPSKSPLKTLLKTPWSTPQSHPWSWLGTWPGTMDLSLTISFEGPPSKHVLNFLSVMHIKYKIFEHQLKSQDPHRSLLTFNHSFSDACTSSSHKSNSADPTIHDQCSENKRCFVTRPTVQQCQALR